MESLQKDGTWPGIDYKNVGLTAYEHKWHSANMLLLAQAYRTPGSGFQGSQKLIQVLNRSFRNWVEHDYQSDNWWHVQIDTPSKLTDILLLAGDAMDAELVKKAKPIIERGTLAAPGARPGGDRIKVAANHARYMLWLGDRIGLKEVLRIMEDEIKFVDGLGMTYGYGYRKILSGFEDQVNPWGRGLQYDYSFHHRTDGVNNTLAYGSNYAHSYIDWAWYVRETSYAFSGDKTEVLVNYYLDGICKMTVFGKYPDVGAKNRGFSRINSLHAYDAGNIRRLLELSDYREDELLEIALIRSGEGHATSSHARFFWHSAYFTFQRPDFFSSVRMHSSRMFNMEYPHNSEGVLNHHMGDGACYVYRRGDEYFNIAPVFDYQKIPGTTVMQKDSLPSEREVAKVGLSDFVGAAVDGHVGAVAFDFKSVHDPLIGRKAWFYFDEELACLGTGISCSKNLHVVSTLNQCLLRDEVKVGRDGKEVILPKEERPHHRIQWVYHDGIGYVFPKALSVQIKNNEALGSWYRGNKHSDVPREEVRQEVFKLWIDHGIRPSDASYEYLVVPLNSTAELEQYVLHPQVLTLSNTPELQAVMHKKLQLVQAVFYTSGKLQVNDALSITCESPAIVLAWFTAGTLSRVTVEDPNRELQCIHLRISGPGVEEKKLSIDLPQGPYAGQSTTVDLNSDM